MSLVVDIEAYMPHRLPMRLVSELLCVEEAYAEAQTTLNIGNVVVDPNGKVEAAALMEIVAQAYAAAHGYQNQRDGKPAMRGYLVGIKDFRIEYLPSAGQRLLIKVRSSRLFEEFYIVEGQILCEDCVVASGTLNIWTSHDTEPKKNEQSASDSTRPL
jgi:predicted hotdog family 3-hydroxylacyl-ACP dehydratase